MDFPRNVYKSPGDISFNVSKSYSTILVNDEKEFDKAIDDGYSESFSDALNDEITGEFEVIKEPKKEVVKKEVVKKEVTKKEVVKKEVVKKEVVKKEEDPFNDF